MSLKKTVYFPSNSTDPFEDVLKQISGGLYKNKRRIPVTLIIPPSPQLPTPGREFLITGPFEGFTYVATLLKQMGHDISVADCRLLDDPLTHALNKVKGAELIFLATYCDSFSFLEILCQEIKKIDPGKIVFLGGPLVTSLPEVLLGACAADFAILGEAELTLIEIIKLMEEKKSEDLYDVRGIAYSKNSKVIINEVRPQIKNLDYLPLLDYSIWPNFEKIMKNGQILISSTRGCPQNCSFCFKTIPKLRLKSLDRFEEEVAYLKKMTNFNYTWLNDLNFNIQDDRAISICEILEKYSVKYHVFARVRNISKNLMEKLKSTGCLGIWFGIESYEQEILDLNFKNSDISMINSAIDLAIDAGLAVRALFIVGLLGETEESLKKMVEFIRQKKFLPLVKYLVPFPGTSLFENAIETKKIKDVPSFLRMLSRRMVRDSEDEIINLTDLKEETLRYYFKEIWKITKEREQLIEYKE